MITRTCKPLRLLRDDLVWAGDADAAEGDTDFLAVVDADPESPTYGFVLGTAPVGSVGNDPHHAEPIAPSDGLLFANGFDATNPVEVARLALQEEFMPHWAQVDPGSNRVVVTGIGADAQVVRMYLIDPDTGVLTLDTAFAQGDERGLGFSTVRDEWPHGTTGPAIPHAALFGR